MADILSKPSDIPRYKRVSKDIKTVVLAKVLQDLQSAPSLRALLHNDSNATAARTTWRGW